LKKCLGKRERPVWARVNGEAKDVFGVLPDLAETTITMSSAEERAGASLNLSTEEYCQSTSRNREAAAVALGVALVEI
jgi:hypothetical protein